MVVLLVYDKAIWCAILYREKEIKVIRTPKSSRMQNLLCNVSSTLLFLRLIVIRRESAIFKYPRRTGRRVHFRFIGTLKKHILSDM